MPPRANMGERLEEEPQVTQRDRELEKVYPSTQDPHTSQ